MSKHTKDALVLVRAVADIIGNTSDEERAAVLVAAWGETVEREAAEEMRERAADAMADLWAGTPLVAGAVAYIRALPARKENKGGVDAE